MFLFGVLFAVIFYIKFSELYFQVHQSLLRVKGYRMGKVTSTVGVVQNRGQLQRLRDFVRQLFIQVLELLCKISRFVHFRGFYDSTFEIKMSFIKIL